MHKFTSLLFALLVLLFTSAPSHAQLYCVYDPLGAQGDYFSLANDYKLAAKRWSVNIELKVYSNDDQLYQDFKSGKCDMASMIGMRAREFNKFTGTLDAPSTLDNYAQVRQAMAVVASPKLAQYMSNGEQEIVGVVPAGALYVVVRDRNINAFDKAVGKKVGIFAWDKSQVTMAEHFKVIPVPLDFSEFGSAFNTGKVDVIVVPLLAYKAFNMDKSVGTSGGIVRRALIQMTMQLVTHAKRFPPDFGQKSREYMYGQVDHTLAIIHKQEQDIDSRTWIYAMKDQLTIWQLSMRALSQKFSAQGIYDERMLAVLKRIRCKTETEEPECGPSPDQQNPRL